MKDTVDYKLLHKRVCNELEAARNDACAYRNKYLAEVEKRKALEAQLFLLKELV